MTVEPYPMEQAASALAAGRWQVAQRSFEASLTQKETPEALRNEARVSRPRRHEGYDPPPTSLPLTSGR